MNITNNISEEINNISYKNKENQIKENSFSGRTYTLNSTNLPLNISSSPSITDTDSNERKDFKLTFVHTLFQKRELELPQVGSFSFSDSPFTLNARLDWLRPIIRRQIKLSTTRYLWLYDWDGPRKDAMSAYIQIFVYARRQVQRILAFRTLVHEPTERAEWWKKALAYHSVTAKQGLLIKKIFGDVRIDFDPCDPFGQLGDWLIVTKCGSLKLPALSGKIFPDD